MCEKCRGALKIKNIRQFSVHPSKDDFVFLDGVIYGLAYAENPEIQAAIKQFKYRYTQDLADHFGEILMTKISQLRAFAKKKIIFIPIPLHRKRLWERGFNQAELIAENIAGRMAGQGQVYSLLRRNRYTSQQAKLGKRDRQYNLEGAFELSGDLSLLEGRVCFLVDDVCTTGSTLDECARILKQKGLKKVYGLVIARAFK